MSIDIENIEYLMFEYFEGNMSDMEKAELLNVIHQNPALESSFAQWAQTYTLVESEPKDYGIAEKIIRKPIIKKWYQKTVYQAAIGLVILSPLILFITPNTENIIDKNEHIKVESKNVEVLHNEVNSFKLVKKAKLFVNKKELDEKTLNFADNQNVILKVEENLKEYKEHENDLDLREKEVDFIPVIAENPENVHREVVQSQLNKVEIDKVVEEKKELKKKKKSVNFKTSGKFIQTNSDF